MQLLEGIRMAPAKKILCLSLFNLLNNSPLDDIPTKRIYESAGISANSFYYHFRDKYDCASFLFRIILFQSMGGRTSSPERIFEDMKATEQGMTGAANAILMEKWHDYWYDMIVYTRKHARLQFLNIFRSRAANSPYYDLKAVWEHNFQQSQAQAQLKDKKHVDFLKEALFSFFELFLIHFFLDLEYDFKQTDVMRMMRLRHNFSESYIKDFI